MSWNPNWTLILASGALAGSGAAFWNTAATRARWLGERELQSRLVEIERGIASTRRLLQEGVEQARARSAAAAELAPPPASGAPARAPAPEPLDDARLATLAGRLDELELLLASASHRSEGPVERPETVEDVLSSELAHQAMLEYQHLFSDPSVEWARRVDALRMLRRFPAEADPLCPRVVDAAIQAFHGEQSPVRVAQVVDAIDGVRDPRLAGELLHLARTSADERLRAEAVGALETFLEDAEVRDFLARARAEDPSGKVRRLAERALD